MLISVQRKQYCGLYGVACTALLMYGTGSREPHTSGCACCEVSVSHIAGQQYMAVATIIANLEGILSLVGQQGMPVVK